MGSLCSRKLPIYRIVHLMIPRVTCASPAITVTLIRSGLGVREVAAIHHVEATLMSARMDAGDPQRLRTHDAPRSLAPISWANR